MVDFDFETVLEGGKKVGIVLSYEDKQVRVYGNEEGDEEGWIWPNKGELLVTISDSEGLRDLVHKLPAEGVDFLRDAFDWFEMDMGWIKDGVAGWEGEERCV